MPLSRIAYARSGDKGDLINNEGGTVAPLLDNRGKMLSQALLTMEIEVEAELI